MSKYNELVFSFPFVRDSAENSLQAMKDVSAFFKEKAKIDEAYAQQLKKLCASKPGSSLFTKDPPIVKETKTLKDSVFAVLEQTTAVANAHIAMSQKVNEQVIKVLDDFVKAKENDKKKLQGDGGKFEAAYQADVLAAKKAKAAYDEAGKAAEQAQQASVKAVAAVGGDAKKKAAADKLVEKTDACKLKLKQTEDQYKQLVDKANESRKKFVGEQMPAVLDGFHKLHRERWEQTISVLKFYTSALASMPAATDDAVTKLKEQLDRNASLDEDLQEFVDEAKNKAAAASEPMAFEQCPFAASESKSSAAADSSAAAAPAPAPATTTTPAAAAATAASQAPAPAPAPAANAASSSDPLGSN